jgi:aminopeptidase N
MKSKIFTPAFLLIVLLVMIACGGKPGLTKNVSHPVDRDWENREIFRQGLVEGERAVLDQLPGASVYHIDLQIPDDFSLLQGHLQVRYTNQEHEPLDALYFRLFPNIAGGQATVSQVRVNGQLVEPVYESQNSALQVPLEEALQPVEQVVVQMDFEVEVPDEMGGNYGLFGYFENVLVLDEFYPVIPAYDDEGWYAEVPPRNGDITYFDASFYVVRVTAPAKLMVVASGLEVERERQADQQVLTFAAGPTRDFYLAASDQYTVISETVGETQVNSYAFDGRKDGARWALEYAVEALESCNQRYGEYPYTEFDIVSTPMQALGIEYPGVVGIALNLYDPEAEVWGLPSRVILESTVAHEVAHQWFYNVVGNDQVHDPWLDEAVVQYVTGLYYADVYGESAAQGYRASWNDRWARVDGADIPIGMSTGDYVGQEYGAIVYGRGPLFITALAEEMGQVSFDQFLRDYYASHKWGIGTNETFKELAEHHCQCDLTALFEVWVHKK